MQRREFITLLGGAAFAPIAARAQSGKIATIGVLLTGAANPNPEAFLAGFGRALRDAGLVEGQNIRLEIRSAGAALRACRIWPRNWSVSRSM